MNNLPPSEKTHILDQNQPTRYILDQQQQPPMQPPMQQPPMQQPPPLQPPEFMLPPQTQAPAGQQTVTMSQVEGGAGLGDVIPDKEMPPLKEQTSLAYTSFNFINAIIGSGVIGMPYAMQQAGFGMGVLLFILVGLVTDTSLVITIKAGRLANVGSYQSLVEAAFGRIGFFVQSILQFLYPFISLISYNVIVGDTLPKVLIRITGVSSKSILAQRVFIVANTTLLITLPLSLYRNISRLARISLVSVGIIIIVIVCMFIRLPEMKEIVPDDPDDWSFAEANIASAIAIMSFAFMCHHCSFLVYDSLSDNTQQRWNKTTHISIGTSAFLSFLFAIAGYASFKSQVQGDVFENYCWGDDLMNVCRCMYAFTILLTYPIECFVARDVLETAFFRDHQPQPLFRHIILTVVIVAVAMLISFTTDCLGVVLIFNGIFCAVPLAYMLPPLCYLKLQEGPHFCREKWEAWSVVLFGVMAILVGTITMFSHLEEVTECSHGLEMDYCMSSVSNSTLAPVEE